MVASPTMAKPTIPEVRDRVAHLYHEAEQASERSNDARLRLQHARHALHGLQHQLHRQRVQVRTTRDEVAASIVQQYQGGSVSAASQIALADDPDALVSVLTTVDEYNARQAQTVADLKREADRLASREQLAERQVRRIGEARATLAKEKTVIDRKASEAKALLGRLVSAKRELDAQREARVSRSAPRVPTSSAPASGRAAAAVSYALAQVGDAYVYGAAGPTAFDCSGLTMMAWGSAGVSLPHSSGAQMGYGTPVSISALQPGDLVFYYSPVSHVAMYIGNGMIVHAANPSVGVRTDPVGLMPISGAVRPS